MSLEQNVSENRLGLSTDKLPATTADDTAINSNMLANMAYEMKTSLNAITGFSEILLTDDLNQEQLGHINEINNASKGLTSLINDVIEFSKFNVKEISAKIENCDLNATLDMIRAVNVSTFYEKGIEFEITKASDIPSEISCDSRYFKGILNRLTYLTIKLADTGTIKIDVSKNNGCVDFKFSGSNLEIDEAVSKDIFAPFSLIENNRSFEVGDIGLGFALVDKMAHIINSTVLVSPGEMGQASILLSVPIQPDVSQSKQRSKLVDEYISKASNKRKVMEPKAIEGKPNILVAEDNPSNQVVIKILLKRMGCDVTVVSYGDEAVEFAKTENFDLILMDMRMPRMDGGQASHLIRQAEIDVPIIALTAMDQSEVIDEYGDGILDDYISKPIDKNNLVDVISRYIVLPVS